MSEWSVGESPWIRTEAVGKDGWTHPGYGQCYFCGVTTVILSAGDVKPDTGRVQAYCKNTECDAREVEVIIMRDNTTSHTRADVRALKAVDEGRDSMKRDMPMGMSWGDLRDRDVDAQDRETLARRTAKGPVVAMHPGTAS